MRGESGNIYVSEISWYNTRMNTMDNAINDIVNAISALRVPAMPGEYDLHALIADALTADGLEFEHERKIAPRCRIDFFMNGIGIEVKKTRPPRAALIKQLQRYLASDELSAIILICPKHIYLPDMIMGKRVISMSLNRLWGVAAV